MYILYTLIDGLSIENNIVPILNNYYKFYEVILSIISAANTEITESRVRMTLTLEI